MKEFTIGEISESFQNGIGKGISFYGRGTKVANIGDLYEFPIFEPVKYSLLEVDEKEKERYLLNRGDLLFVRSSLKKEGVAFCSMYNSSEDCLFSSFMIRVRLKKEVCDPKYVSYILRGNVCRERLINASNTSTITNINQEGLASVQLPLPPLSTQKKIAAILDAADLYRQKTKTLIEKYDLLAQSLFLDMFGDTWSNPKGWKVMHVEDVSNSKKHSIKAGPFGSSLKKEFYVEQGYKIYGQEQVIKDDLSFGNYYIDEKKYKELENCKVSVGDVLISLVGTYGKVSVVPENFEPGIINPRLMKISPNRNIIRPDFLKKLLQNSGAEIQMKNHSRGGTMDIVNVGIMRKIEIPVPPIELQNKFAERFQLIEAQKQQAQTSLKKTEDLFNSLLQKSFKGELVKEY